MIPRQPREQDTPQYQEETTTGIAARQVLESPAFTKATTALRDKLLHDWLHTAPDDVKGREWFHQQALAQQAFITNLTKLMTTGTMAAESLKQMADKKPARRRTT